MSLQAAGLPKAVWAGSNLFLTWLRPTLPLVFPQASHQGCTHITWLLFVAVSANTTTLILVQIIWWKKSPTLGSLSTPMAEGEGMLLDLLV